MVKVWSPVEQSYEDRYEYVKNPMAEQTDINDLFENITIVRYKDLDEEDEWGGMEYLQKIHVETCMSDKSITRKGLEKYCELIGGIYINGNADIDEEKGKNRKGGRENIVGGHTENGYLQEARQWKELFDDSSLPSDLYQYSRSLRDAFIVGYESMETVKMLSIVAESIVWSEEFLKYGDRNINGNGKKIIINADDMAFFNGKVYYQLAIRFGRGIELEAEWEDSFWMLSYACMCRANSLITEDDEKYVLVNYYIGNIAERMMKRIATVSSKKDLYLELGNVALEHYGIAKDALGKGKNYVKENGMEKNIEDGIKTVETWINM